MTPEQARTAFKAASVQMSFVNLTEEERKHLIELAEQIKEILDAASKRPHVGR